MSEETAQYPEPYTDRIGLLVFAGVVEILLGLLALLLGIAAVASIVLMPEKAGISVRTMGYSMVQYGIAGLFFIAVGIGSIRARRWARALMLAVGWMWLAIGVLSVGALAVTMPSIMEGMASGTDMPPGARGFMMAMMAGVSCVIYLVLPLFFILIYRSPNVKAACHHRDPRESVLDTCPLLVRIAGVFLLLAGVGALSVVAMPAAPFGSRIVTGWPVAAAGAVLAAVYLVLACQTIRLRMWAWWADVVLLLAASAYGLWSFLQVDITRLYEAMTFPPEQVAMMERMFSGGTMDLFMGMGSAAAICILLYLLYIRRYFVQARQAGGIETA